MMTSTAAAAAASSEVRSPQHPPSTACSTSVGFNKLALSKSALSRFAFKRAAASTVGFRRAALSNDALSRLAFNKLALSRFAFSRFAFSRFAFSRLAFSKAAFNSDALIMSGLLYAQTIMLPTVGAGFCCSSTSMKQQALSTSCVVKAGSRTLRSVGLPFNKFAFNSAAFSRLAFSRSAFSRLAFNNAAFRSAAFNRAASPVVLAGSCMFIVSSARFSTANSITLPKEGGFSPSQQPFSTAQLINAEAAIVGSQSSGASSRVQFKAARASRSFSPTVNKSRK